MKFLLSKLPLKKSGVIKHIHGDKAIEERLHTFGLIKGVAITPIRNTPLGCPRIYKCLNTSLAVRNNIAKEIEIETKL